MLKNKVLLLIITVTNFYNFKIQSKVFNFSNVSNNNTHTKENNSFNKVQPLCIEKPTSVSQIQSIVKNAFKNKKNISILGAGQSQGNQTHDTNSILIDLSKFNRIKNLDIQNKLITVEPGAKWNKIIKHINPHELSIKAMQSYNNFSVGGSISVNAHGQNIHCCNLSKTIKSLKIINYQGNIVKLDNKNDPLLFSLIIGGYGLFGIIIEATLELVSNQNLNKRSFLIKTQDYFNYFNKSIKNNHKIAFHSARLSISPKNLFQDTIVINYSSNPKNNFDQNLITNDLIKNTKERIGINILRNSNFAKKYRLVIEHNLIEKSQDNITRNQFLNLTINNLKTFNDKTKDILQEYFIPCNKINNFIEELSYIIKNYKINLLNASIRYVDSEKISFLNYSPQKSFAVVLYINVPNNDQSYNHAKTWTQEIIKIALNLKGRFYLPYQHFASKELIRKSYPEFNSFLKLKTIYDPHEIFFSKFYSEYK